MGLSNKELEKKIKDSTDGFESIKIFNNGNIVLKVSRDATFRGISNVILKIADKYADPFEKYIEYIIKLDSDEQGYTIRLRFLKF